MHSPPLRHGRRSPRAAAALVAAGVAIAVVGACADGTAPSPRSAGSPGTAATAIRGEPPVFGRLRPLRVASVMAPVGGEVPSGATVPTYDGSGQVVHPDVIVFPSAWRGHRYWMAVTPYPGGNAGFENPTLLASDDGVVWQLPAGAPSPVIQRPATGYLSDPDLVYRADRDELWLYYRHSGAGEDEIWLTRTADGVTWSAPTVAFKRRSYAHVSPSVAPVGARGGWRAWYVDAGEMGCRATRTVVRELRSGDGVRWHARRPARAAGTGPVSEASPVRLAQPGYVVWHLDAQYVPARREYWAIYAAYPADGAGCAATDVFFATSPDGVRWTTYPTPLLARHEAPLLQDVVYRSTFAYDPTARTLTVWYSGATVDKGTEGVPARGYVWSAAVATYVIDDVFAHVRQPATAATLGARGARVPRRRPSPPPPGARPEEMP